MEVEIEKKYIVSLKTFNEIYRAIGLKSKSKIVHQTNHYFDTPDLFYFNENITLRVREINNSYVFTIKSKLEKNSMFVKSLEYDFDLTKKQFINLSVHGLIPYELRVFLNNRNIKANFIYIGSLTTIRKSLICEDMIISFDENKYLNKVDYEIEIESLKCNFDNPIVKLIEQYKDATISNKNGKYSRFIKSFNGGMV